MTNTLDTAPNAMPKYDWLVSTPEGGGRGGEREWVGDGVVIGVYESMKLEDNSSGCIPIVKNIIYMYYSGTSVQHAPLGSVKASLIKKCS